MHFRTITVIHTERAPDDIGIEQDKY